MWTHIKNLKKNVFSCSSNVSLNLATKKPILSNKHHKTIYCFLKEREKAYLNSPKLFSSRICVCERMIYER